MPFAAKAIPARIAVACPPSEFKKFNIAVKPFTAGSKTGISALPIDSPKSLKDSPKVSTEPANPTAAAWANLL